MGGLHATKPRPGVRVSARTKPLRVSYLDVWGCWFRQPAKRRLLARIVRADSAELRRIQIAVRKVTPQELKL